MLDLMTGEFLIYELFSITGGELSINESFKNFSESYYWSTTKQGFNDSSDEWFWILDFRSNISWGFMLTNEGLAKSLEISFRCVR